MRTLESGINVRSGIMVRVGQFGQNNKSTIWNKHTGGLFFDKSLPQYQKLSVK